MLVYLNLKGIEYRERYDICGFCIEVVVIKIEIF